MMKDSFKIYFVWTGGFTRIKRLITLTEDLLTQNENQELSEFVEKANFFELSSYYPPPPYSHDFFVYNTIVELGKQKHAVKTTDFSIPEILLPLIEFLKTKTLQRESKWVNLEEYHNFRIGDTANTGDCPGEIDWSNNFFEEEFDHKKILESKIDWPPIKEKSLIKWKSETLEN